MTIPSQIKTTRGKKVASTAITTTSTTVVNANILITVPYQNTSLQKTSVTLSRGKENKPKSRKISLATDENQDICSYDRLVAKPTLDNYYLTIPDSQS